MNILVYNIAAEYAGALTMLKEFYDSVKNYKDKSIHWYFVVSTNVLQNTDNITVIQVSKIKKSWFNRWKYDTFEVQKLIKKFQINKIFSMQNMTIKNCKLEQVVYMHQALQFSPKRYSFFKKEERVYAMRQKIICNMIRHSLKKANKIIVQTKWIKDACIEWTGINEKIFEVIPPKVSFNNNVVFDNKGWYNNFFYPAGGGNHKNHYIILEACKLLRDKGINNYQVNFTLSKDESYYAKNIIETIEKENLPINCIGIVSKSKVEEYYKKSVVIFPSYLETFGLPLLEAKMAKCIVIASDLPFSHEILDRYPNVYFFKYDDKYKLASLIEKCINEEIKYCDGKVSYYSNTTYDIIKSILEI